MLRASVRGKLLGVVLGLSGVSVALALFGWNRMGVIDHHLADIVDNAAKSEVLAVRARAELVGLQRAEKSLLLAPDPSVFAEQQESIRAHRAALGELIAQIEPLSAGKTLEHVRAFRDLLDDLNTVTDEVITLARADSAHEAEVLSNSRGQELARAAAVPLERLAAGLDGENPAAAIAAAGMMRELLRIELYGKGFLTSDNPERRASYERSLATAIDAVALQRDRLRPMLQGERLAALEEFSGRFEAWAAVNREILDLARQDTRARAEAMSRGAGHDAFLAASTALQEIERLKEEQMHHDKELADSAYARATVLMAVLATAGISVAGVIAVLLVNAIVRTLLAVVGRTQAIARGELHGEPLTTRSRDEIGVLADAINEMQASLREIVSGIGANSEQVSAAATEVAATSEQMAATTDHQRSQLAQVAAAIEQMAATVTEVSAQTADVARQSGQAGNDASEGGDIVRRTVEEMGQIASQVESTSVAVGQLSDRAVQIGEILNVINDIADQTNLLALNAAIEAARAGEHGRGFAVVADEVRKLAERTQQATQEVSRSVGEIRSSTGEATEMMVASKSRVTSGVELAREAGRSLERIVAGSGGLARSIDSIASAVEEQSATSGEIARAVEVLSAAADESAQGASQAAAAATQLSGNAESLRELVSRFKV